MGVTERMDDTAERVLRESDTVAVVGLSTDPAKAAHSVPASLRAAGFQLVPVHPVAESVLGLRAYRELADIPDPVDLVVVFRPAQEAPRIARQAVAIGAKALWLQEGIVSAEAREIAGAAGLSYVEDRCTGVVRALAGISKF